MIQRTVLALLVTVLLSCGGSSSSVRRCPDSPQVPCLTTEECSIDRARGCERCRCADPGFVRPEQQDPLPPASPE